MLKTGNLWQQVRVSKLYKFTKMKKLGKLNLMKEKMLSHDELVSFRGGSGGGYDCEYYSCSCYDGTGAWTGLYCDGGSNALATYCSGSGGQCTTMGGG